MNPDPELAEDWTLAISQSAHADLTHLQLILRQTTGVTGLPRSSYSELRPALVKTWGL